MEVNMKAANLYAPGDIRTEQVPVPKPGPGEVLVRVRACGVCGSDISRIMETGTYRFPTIPGHEFAGEVAELGPGVENVAIGDRVTVIPLIQCNTCSYCRIGEYQLCENYNYLGSRTDGAYAEYVVAPACNLLPLPEGVSFEMGAMTDPAAVALHAVKKLGLEPGDRVAVFGVGPIGAFALQWAKIMGASETIAVDIFPEKLAVAGELGADHCINGLAEDPVAKIKELTGGRGVERSVEFAGHKATQEQSILATAKLGSIVWGGISHSELPLQEKAVDDILRKEIVLVGSWNSSFAPFVSDWEKALLFMGLGRLRGEELISHRLPLEDIKSAFIMMQERKEYFNKVVFFPDMDRRGEGARAGRVDLSKYIDHTILKATASQEEIEKLCQEASKHQFAAVCVNPIHVSQAAKLLKGTGVKVATVVGFPLGANLTELKVGETRAAIAQGAEEIDMVLNVGALKEGRAQFVQDEIKAVVDAAGGALVKVIIETSYLSGKEKVLACRLAEAAGAHFVKTSTGFSSGGATIADVRLMRTVVSNHIGVKASGGIRDYETAKAMVDAGATRLGTSAGVDIVQG